MRRARIILAIQMLALGGLGLAALPWYVAHESVRSGAVLPVLAEWKLPSQEVHAVYPSPRQVPAKVIGFVEWLQGEMGETWWSDTW